MLLSYGAVSHHFCQRKRKFASLKPRQFGFSTGWTGFVDKTRQVEIVCYTSFKTIDFDTKHFEEEKTKSVIYEEESMQGTTPDANNLTTQMNKKGIGAKRGCLIGIATCIIVNALYLMIIILPEYGVKWFVPQNYMTSDMGRNFALGFFPLVFLSSLVVGSLLSLIIWFGTWLKGGLHRSQKAK